VKGEWQTAKGSSEGEWLKARMQNFFIIPLAFSFLPSAFLLAI
jgi:hypothetical protein